jgi:hypothetical protein
MSAIINTDNIVCLIRDSQLVGKKSSLAVTRCGLFVVPVVRAAKVFFRRLSNSSMAGSAPDADSRRPTTFVR